MLVVEMLGTEPYPKAIVEVFDFYANEKVLQSEIIRWDNVSGLMLFAFVCVMLSGGNKVVKATH